MNTPQDVYIPVDAIKGAQYFILCKSNLAPINQLLEKKENVYVLTEDEFKKAISDAYSEGSLFENHRTNWHGLPNQFKTKVEYLNNLKP